VQRHSFRRAATSGLLGVCTATTHDFPTFNESTMTSADWWLIGARLLGTYLLVLAGTYAVGAFAMFGVGLPDSSNRLVVAAAPILQAAVMAVGGLWLIRRSAVPPPTGAHASAASDSAFEHGLQLVGIFYLVSGAADLARVVIDSYFIGADWQIRSSEVASGLVEFAAGTALTFSPGRVAARLTVSAAKRTKTTG
jgi:hypothetical protein